MPTYEYKCDGCGAEFERFQSIKAPPVKRCPECGKAKVRRLISTGAGLIFKGSGFYITDYRDKSYTDKAKSESGGADKTGGDKGGDKGGEKSGGDKSGDRATSDSKSESKPESKSSTESKAESKPESKPKSEPKPKKKE